MLWRSPYRGKPRPQRERPKVFGVNNQPVATVLSLAGSHEEQNVSAELAVEVAVCCQR
jgi:hypothetical protein